ncbi:hypothetical protein AALP_AA3G333400 [Arabis alpina]|uniref:Uncharacterized protein n=1 Tax=Arabis alpina TaxID=50452 RepID=A0A087HDC2_ARAAL|nr:hypothetical protein AALP_AA3G333400 [Arabis alpina]
MRNEGLDPETSDLDTDYKALTPPMSPSPNIELVVKVEQDKLETKTEFSFVKPQPSKEPSQDR